VISGTIAGTDIRVSRIALGTASLHRLFAARDRDRVLRTALEHGVTHFDTAPYYGFGLAEEDLGRMLQGQRDRITISTKFGLYPPGGGSRSGLSLWSRKALGRLHRPLLSPVVNWELSRAKASLRLSLKRLRTGHVDFLFAHEPSLALLDSEEILRWLEDEQKRGSIRAWGVAGIVSSIEPFVRARHRLAMVVQTKDSVVGREADIVTASGRVLQFTYGYLSSLGGAMTAEAAVAGALERNSSGAIIVSTTRPMRIPPLVQSVQR
jgi:aryl-alcohol dehydrogenase-like predicted oxidoreductase